MKTCKRFLSIVLTVALVVSMLTLMGVSANAAPVTVTKEILKAGIHRIDFAIVKDEGTFYVPSTEKDNNIYRFVGPGTEDGPVIAWAVPYTVALVAADAAAWKTNLARKVPAPVRLGYDFVGWGVAIAGGETIESGETTAYVATGADAYRWSTGPVLKDMVFSSAQLNGKNFAEIVALIFEHPAFPATLTLDDAHPQDNLRFVALWKVQQYTVKYDAGTGNTIANTTAQTVTRTVTFSAKYSDAEGGIPAAVKSGYTFIGWNTKPDGTGTGISIASPVPTLTGGAPQQTFYAIYEANSVFGNLPDWLSSLLDGMFSGESGGVPNWVWALLGVGGLGAGASILGMIGAGIATLTTAAIAALLALPLFAFAPEIKDFILRLVNKEGFTEKDFEKKAPVTVTPVTDAPTENNPVAIPKTGDSSTAPLGLLALLTFSGGAAIWLGRKRRKEEAV